MCGIIGLISDSKGVMAAEKRGFIKDSLVVDSLRGEDSTGIFTVDHDGTLQQFKSAMAGWDFINHRKVEKIMGSMMDKCLIVGHNRWATRGAINSVNAHPFHHGKIIGVHNGSLTNHEKLLVDGDHFDVDSDAVFHSINKVGVEETVKGMNGAYAIVYYDEEKHTVNMFRNEERPLFTATVEHVYDGHNTILYASEPGMIDWIANRNKMKVKEMVLLKTHTLYSLDLKTMDYSTTALDKYKAPVRDYTPNRNINLTPSKESQNTRLNRRRLDRSKGFLAEIGLELGDTVNFWVHKATHYGNKDPLGEISGTLQEEPWCDIIVHQVDAETIALAKEEDVLQGEISYCNLRAGNLEIYLGKHSIAEIYEEPVGKQGSKKEKEKEDKKVVQLPHIEDKVAQARKDREEAAKAVRKAKRAEAKKEKSKRRIKKEEEQKEEKNERTLSEDVKAYLAGRVGKPKDNIEQIIEDIRTGEVTPAEKKPYSPSCLNQYKGENGQYISLPDFQKAVQDGCDMCQAPIKPSAAFDVKWTDSHKPICPSCALDLDDWGCMAGSGYKDRSEV